MQLIRNRLLANLQSAAFILAALLGAGLLSACGQKGPLKLPTPPAANNIDHAASGANK